ncbi:MAG TPA: lipopolysaccharide heptosyltransferase I [Planctomycetota bacterium]|nr:lipopolysaccharide heptosyltransferase I [Planctomycetota bacterium]
MTRILLVRLSSLGDVLFTLPALARLREGMPGARIEWAVEDRFAPLLEGHPLLDEVVVYPRSAWSRGVRRPWLLPSGLALLARHFAALRSRRYDLVLDFQGNLKSALHVRAAGARRSVGFAAGHTREGGHFFVSGRVVPPPGAVHRVDKFLSLLSALSLPTARPERRTPLPLDAERVRGAREALPEGTGALVLLHPATSAWGRDKQWPAERFAALAERLRREAGTSVLVTWGPGERELAERVAREGSGTLAPPTGSLKDLAALLSLADLFVGADTGVLHLACALGRPAVGLYGPTDPAVYGPVGENALAVRREAPPARRERSRISPAMLAIEVEDVLGACQRLLERARGKATGKRSS